VDSVLGSAIPGPNLNWSDLVQNYQLSCGEERFPQSSAQRQRSGNCAGNCTQKCIKGGKLIPIQRCREADQAGLCSLRLQIEFPETWCTRSKLQPRLVFLKLPFQLKPTHRHTERALGAQNKLLFVLREVSAAPASTRRDDRVTVKHRIGLSPCPTSASSADSQTFEPRPPHPPSCPSTGSAGATVSESPLPHDG